MLALVVRMPPAPGAGAARPTQWFTWPSDTVVPGADYEIRLSASAVAEMRAEARSGARIRGGKIETGGTLLGGFDSAAGVVWVDEATGPPPDSRLSEVHFEHGVRGVEDLIAARTSATARVTTFVGMWHSHPYGEASPSPTDRDGMDDLVLPIANAPPRALLLIVGGLGDRWRSWLERATPPDWFARVIVRQVGTGHAPRSTRATNDGVRWWSGGWLAPQRARRPRRARRWLRLRPWKRVKAR